MKDFLKLDMGDGATLFIRTIDCDVSGSRIPASGGKAPDIAKGQKVFEKALPGVAKFAGTVAEKMRDLAPDEVEISFSVGLSSEWNAVISSAGVEASFEVKLKWENKEKEKTGE